jgi:anti-sigma28 factor (negative regulator of flagellin synthesis)
MPYKGYHMNKQNMPDNQDKLEHFKQAVQNNTYAINSDRIASALLEAEKIIKQYKQSTKQPEPA